jgi:hypothetical protein
MSDEEIDRIAVSMYVPIGFGGHPSQYANWCREFARAILAGFEADAERFRWLVAQHDPEDLPIAQVVWKRDSEPRGEWVNLIDGTDLTRHIDAAMVSTARGCNPEKAGTSAGAMPNAPTCPAAGNPVLRGTGCGKDAEGQRKKPLESTA